MQKLRKNTNYLLTKENDKLKLQVAKDFTFPKKIYGNELEVVKRFANTFLSNSSSMGVLFSGFKGSGKTLTAKLLTKEVGLPVILITSPYTSQELHKFFNDVQQEVVVFIDEFEKVYKENSEQEQFLPILDGVFDSKKLFIFTSNTFRINEFLKSRPSRIRYHKEYMGLEEDTIEEIIDDLLNNKEHKAGLLSVIELLGSISADTLITLIDEMNLYNEDVYKSIKYLNVQIEHTLFDVLMFIGGKRYFSTARFNPLTSSHFYLDYIDEKGNERYISGKLRDMDLTISNGEFIYKDYINGNKFKFIPKKSDKLTIFKEYE